MRVEMPARGVRRAGACYFSAATPNGTLYFSHQM